MTMVMHRLELLILSHMALTLFSSIAVVVASDGTAGDSSAVICTVLSSCWLSEEDARQRGEEERERRRRRRRKRDFEGLMVDLGVGEEKDDERELGSIRP